MKRRYASLADYFAASTESQVSLAARLGVSPSYMSLLVAGKRQPALHLALEITAATGVSVESLVASEANVS